jgi:hypothetical protein
MGTLRTAETQKKYRELIDAGGLKEGCALCTAPAVKTFTYWKVVNNTFPYDKVAKVHHMVLPLRHASETELTPEEWEEYQTIKNEYVQNEYEYIIEPTQKMKSIPAHFHIHLIIAKE